MDGSWRGTIAIVLWVRTLACHRRAPHIVSCRRLPRHMGTLSAPQALMAWPNLLRQTCFRARRRMHPPCRYLSMVSIISTANLCDSNELQILRAHGFVRGMLRGLLRVACFFIARGHAARCCKLCLHKGTHDFLPFSLTRCCLSVIKCRAIS